jgi:hypothetical protein
MTRQRFVRGRDLDPARRQDCARYMIDWVKFLRTKEKLPVKYVSLHNEGEDFSRWPVDGSTADKPSHDYNLFWPSAQVVDFLKFMRRMLDKEGLADVGLAPGETTNWYRFVMWGYATAIAADPEALGNLGLITSHGFTGGRDVWYGGHDSRGNDLLRLQRPELHSWTTSMSWRRMDADFVEDIRGQIYKVKVNGVIPWAGVQTNRWTGGDPNPGTAFRIDVEKAAFAVLPGHYFYKQVTRAGQPGTHVCAVASPEPALNLIAFSGAGTRHPDAFLVINTGQAERAAAVAVSGSSAPAFEAFRTSASEQYQKIGRLAVEGGRVSYTAPPRSVTTFFAAR